jgi:hypothetical protein
VVGISASAAEIRIWLMDEMCLLFHSFSSAFTGMVLKKLCWPLLHSICNSVVCCVFAMASTLGTSFLLLVMFFRLDV